MPTSIRWRRPACSCRPIHRSSNPEDLAGVPISVGYQSGSHYSTIQALEPYMPADKINLSFADGMLFQRMELLLDGKAQASALFSGPYYFAEQLGFRKVIDTTFMIATMITGDPDPEDLRKFFRALRRAQRDIDLRPDLYTHYYKKEFPERYHAQMDTRRWGPGERLVFEPYTKEVYEETFRWIADHGIFADSGMGSGGYEKRSFARRNALAASPVESRASAIAGARRVLLAGWRAYRPQLLMRGSVTASALPHCPDRRSAASAFSASLIQRSSSLRHLAAISASSPCARAARIRQPDRGNTSHTTTWHALTGLDQLVAARTRPTLHYSCGEPTNQAIDSCGRDRRRAVA